MEHEVFVPFPVGDVRRALSDAERVARCVPGLQRDAGGAGDAPGEAVAGRLRLRIGGSTITYRGTLRVAVRDGAHELTAEGTEARGSATVRLTLLAVPAEAPGGTRLACTGTVERAGRLAEVDARTAAAAGRRLMDRFATALAGTLAHERDELPDADAESAGAEDAEEAGTAEDVPADDDVVADVVAEVVEDVVAEDVPGGEPPAEAAHARRTMIGRSAEEVDHAPPRGRYAPVPAPETTTGRAALRWAAPAAAVALASAVVVGRVLRRRR
ncbi:SRPBCC family protein [Streptomyces caatingaensis]|uniref:Carbon monoxide dehydrogenase subunit G n=1 Tax=Streptomyces caatingaensis TaxID=1678637 RepID=A0A0K9X834_9ACTN|nr:SRPBCC family protein [Streptomyces caatingaensis]KNB49241.1 carbon monoxide dehydrogenase subunit G [Streptomyces caatingaensis]